MIHTVEGSSRKIKLSVIFINKMLSLEGGKKTHYDPESFPEVFYLSIKTRPT